MSEPAVYLITGPSAAGKTTVGRALAERFDRSVFLEGDAYRRAIVSGRSEMTPDPSAEALGQLKLRYGIATTVADVYFDADFNVVAEDVIAGELLLEVVAMIRSRPLYVVVLLPTVDAVTRRDAGREQDGYSRFTVEELHRGFAQETPRIGLWLDSSRLTVEETVDEILRNAVTARV